MCVTVCKYRKQLLAFVIIMLTMRLFLNDDQEETTHSGV